MYKKCILLVSCLVLLFSIVPAVHAEQINTFSVDISIQKDASVHVTEHIAYDFGTLDRHGIYRKIPLKYDRNGGAYTLRVSGIKVKVDGTSTSASISYPGDAVQIKIGDANKTITGVHVYEIAYTVDRAINFFNDHDELYWNVTGNEWQVPIVSAAAHVSFNGASPVTSTCFYGGVGETKNCEKTVDGSSVVFGVPRQLGLGEGLTVVYGFPKGLVTQPTQFQNVKYFLVDNGVLVVPLAIFFIMFYLWWTRGRDPKGVGTIVPEYEPPQGLTPLEVGILIDERADKGDIAAEIIYLATLGFITITRDDTKQLLVFNRKDYKIELLKDVSSAPTDFDKALLTLLFAEKPAFFSFDQLLSADIKTVTSVHLSDLKSNPKISSLLLDVKNKAVTSLVTKDYFPSNPWSVKTWWVIGGIATGFTLIFVCSALNYTPVISWISGIVSSVVIVAFGAAMPKRTEKGVEAKRHAQGLKLYIEVAEKDRLAFHNDPAKNPERFENILPYAMALGVDKAWAKVFEGIEVHPQWYSDPSSPMFNAIVFHSMVHDFSSSVSTMVTTASAGRGGSGFSGGGVGGGFGGGGGGSW